jgi:EmrB/QacA subfamily drug resistance transporter
MTGTGQDTDAALVSTASTASRRAGVCLLVLVCSAQFMLQLDFSIVNVALPTIQRSLHMLQSDLQWVVTGYALTFGSLLLLGGRLADRFDRRLTLVAGLVLFGVASTACGFARWSIMLIVSRIVQGAAGALVSPSALSLLTNANAQGAARSRALAIWQATTAAGATAGILAGGLLTQYLGWRAIFLVNPPLIAIVIPLVRQLPAVGERLKHPIDVRGALLISLSIAALIFGLSHGQQAGFDSTVTIVALAAACALAVVFIWSQRVSAAPMVPLAIVADPGRRSAMTAMLLVGAVLAGYVYFVSLYLQRVLGFDPLTTGLALVPATVAVVITSTLITRRVLARITLKATLLISLASLGLGQLWLAQISAHTSYAAVVLPGLVLTAFGIGLGLPTISIAITSGVPDRDQGLAGAIFTTCQQTGAAVGLAVLATVAAARTTNASGSLVAGYRLAFYVAVGIAGAAILLVIAQLRTRRSGPSPARERPAEYVPASAGPTDGESRPIGNDLALVQRHQLPHEPGGSTRSPDAV